MRIVSPVVFALPVLLAGCGAAIVPGHNPMHYGSSEARQVMAGTDTPVVIFGNPFPGTSMEELSGIVTDALKNTASDVETRFVPGSAETAQQANGNVVIVFNPVGNINPGNICGMTDLPTEPLRRPIHAEAAFCAPGARTTSQGWLAKAETAKDADFIELVHATVATLFPTYFCHDLLCQ